MPPTPIGLGTALRTCRILAERANKVRHTCVVAAMEAAEEAAPLPLLNSDPISFLQRCVRVPCFVLTLYGPGWGRARGHPSFELICVLKGLEDGSASIDQPMPHCPPAAGLAHARCSTLKARMSAPWKPAIG